jgi:hypothetical protein
VKLAKDLREFIELLNSRRVDYLVVGGMPLPFTAIPASLATLISSCGPLPRTQNA